MRSLLAALLAGLLLLPGCLQPAPSGPAPDGRVGGLEVHYAPGALSTVRNPGAEAVAVGLPEGALLLEEGRFTARREATLAPGASLAFLPSPGRTGQQLTVAGTSHALQAEPLPTLVNGTWVVEALKLQQERFPDRNPGHPNYDAALDWAAAEMRAWGYQVVVDEYATRDLPQAFCPPVPVSGQQACPASFANVVATKPGRDPLGPIVLVGGHYDIVPQVTHGAYDNTAGAMAVMAMARAVAPYAFNETLVFALWGGEESGVLGSSSWLATHPVERARLSAYWNSDTMGLTWPAPRLEPDPTHVVVGPEAGQGGDPVKERLVAWARGLQARMGYPDEREGRVLFTYGGAVEELPTTDHLAFMAAGVPSFVPESFSKVSGKLRIHTEEDTLANITRYVWEGKEADFEAGPLAGQELAEAERLLAASFEPTMWFWFYHFIAADEGMAPLG